VEIEPLTSITCFREPGGYIGQMISKYMKMVVRESREIFRYVTLNPTYVHVHTPAGMLSKAVDEVSFTLSCADW